MARTNADTSTNTAAPFAVNDAPAQHADSHDDDHDAMDALDDMDYSAGPDPIGIVGVTLTNITPNDGKQIWEFELEGTEFEGMKAQAVWLDPKDREDNARMRAFIRALGLNWNATNERPDGGWKALRGRRARAVMTTWEKSDGDVLTGEIAFQIAKYRPQFSDTDATKSIRAAFAASCAAAGIECKLEQNTKGKRAGWWSAKGPLLGGCGLLPVAQ